MGSEAIRTQYLINPADSSFSTDCPLHSQQWSLCRWHSALKSLNHPLHLDFLQRDRRGFTWGIAASVCAKVKSAVMHGEGIVVRTSEECHVGILISPMCIFGGL